MVIVLLQCVTGDCLHQGGSRFPWTVSLHALSMVGSIMPTLPKVYKPSILQDLNWGAKTETSTLHT